ncbi:uncharacterized protein PG986_010705 [Apiospora aurea]|uniref:Clr5 domain-containing protein n=1 Tax=Apiospora aurea TaxID=335848 RepID=A0ABR1Q313_9PEZI
MDSDAEKGGLSLSATTPSKAVGKRTYAKPFQFDDHRDTISYLYARDGLALTLKETMLVMEKRYNFFATHRAADGKVPLSEDWVRDLLRRVSLERTARGRTAPPLASLQLPDILRVPEHYMRYLILACRLLEYGRVRQDFQVVNLCFDRFADIILRRYHPAAWAYGYIAGFLLGFQSMELGRSYARYVQRLDAISDHPQPKGPAALCLLTPTFEPGGKGASFSDISLLCGRPLCEVHLAELDDDDDALGQEIRDRGCRAWVCIPSGSYDEAESVLDGVSEAELALGYSDHPEYVISYYDSRALSALSGERQTSAQVVEAATALIDLLKGRYGLADHRTIDAYADLEAYLHGKGCEDQAEEVRQDIYLALDAVEEKMNAAHRSSRRGYYPPRVGV